MVSCSGNLAGVFFTGGYMDDLIVYMISAIFNLILTPDFSYLLVMISCIGILALVYRLTGRRGCSK